MSEKRDLERDREAARMLGRLPAPEVPADLTARIVKNATRLPQQSAVAHTDAPDHEAADAETTPAPARRRWLPPAIGAVIAASAVCVLLLPRQTSAPAGVIPSSAPSAPSVRAAPPRPSVRPESSAATPHSPVKRMDTAENASAQDSPDASERPSSIALSAPEPVPPLPDHTPDAPATVPAANELPLPSPAVPDEPARHAAADPGDYDAIAAPMPRGEAAPGLGITGAAPATPNSGSSPAPRF